MLNASWSTCSVIIPIHITWIRSTRSHWYIRCKSENDVLQLWSISRSFTFSLYTCTTWGKTYVWFPSSSTVTDSIVSPNGDYTRFGTNWKFNTRRLRKRKWMNVRQLIPNDDWLRKLQAMFTSFANSYLPAVMCSMISHISVMTLVRLCLRFHVNTSPCSIEYCPYVWFPGVSVLSHFIPSVLAVQNMGASGTVVKDQEIEFNALEGSLSMMSKGAHPDSFSRDPFPDSHLQYWTMSWICEIFLTICSCITTSPLTPHL